MGDYFAHERAYIEQGAVIGKGTRVWVNCQVRSGAVIGCDCVLGKDTFVDSGVTMGDRVKIQNGVSVYNGVVIADDVFVGPNAVFTNDRVPRAFNHDWQISRTFVDRGASIGANATVVCGITIGEYAMVGAGSVVIRDVPAYTLVVGNPAQVVSLVCRCGARVSPDETCPSCGERVPSDLPEGGAS